MYKEVKSRLITQKSKSESTIKNLEVFEDESYDISDLLNETDISEEKYA